MQITYSPTSIIFTPDNPSEFREIAFLDPYKYGSKIERYRVPMTLDTFNWLFSNYRLEQDENWFKTISWLEMSAHLTRNQFLESKDSDLRPYQYQGTLWLKFTLETLKAAGLFWDPRTGKTRTTVKATKDYKKIIVLSLAGQEDNWTSTYKDYGSHTKIYSLHKKSVIQKQKIYQQFMTDESAILVGSINGLTSDILDPAKSYYLNQVNSDLLVVDEVHKIKNHKTKLFKGATKLKTLSKYTIGLTGTPVSRSSEDIIGIITFLFKDYSATFLKNYFFELETNYFNKYGSTTIIKKKKELEWLNFMSIMFSSVKKEMALPWAKIPEHSNIYLTPDSTQWKMYRNCLEHMQVSWAADKIEQLQEVIVQMKRLQQISCSPILINPELSEHSVKEKWVIEFVSNPYNYDGLIIFTTNSSYIPRLKQKLEELGKVVGTITGKTKNKVYEQDMFQYGYYDIIICNIQAGSKGITLDRANTIIFLDKDWKPDENKQAEERFISTIPSREKLRKIYSLILEGQIFINGLNIETIDIYMNQVIDNKVKQSEIVNMFRELLLKTK